MTDDSDFIHRFVPGTRPGALPVVLLHGTGGDENDLIPLGQHLAPGAPLLSPRGKVLENGMPRYFRRLAEGVFDIPDLRHQTADLAGFLREARIRYGLGDTPPIAIGLSNGANIAGALLLLHPGSLSGAVLLRPMVPLVPEQLPDLRGVRVLLVAGLEDPLVSPAQTRDLAGLLEKAGAEVSIHWSNAGHRLVQEDLDAAERWLAVATSTA
jgi:phospholipase/carboxylesterase